MYEEDKKKYSVEGTVTISTEEYKDLIIENTSVKAKNDKQSTENWNLRNKVSELEAVIKSQKEELDLMTGFVASDMEVSSKYFNYKRRSPEKEEDN